MVTELSRCQPSRHMSAFSEVSTLSEVDDDDMLSPQEAFDDQQSNYYH